jgi:hypothetical protein
VREVHDVAPSQLRAARSAGPHANEEVSLPDGVMPLLDLASIVESVLEQEAVAP